MNFNIRKSLFLALVLILSSSATIYAQSSASVSGTLIDAANSQPLSFATVFIVQKNSTQPGKGMQTDINGKFNLTGLKDGAYTLRASFVGYVTVNTDITIAAAKRNIQLQPIKLAAAEGVLKQVEVTAQKSQINLGIDKKSFDVSQSLVSQGGSATDLLTNVPSVQVDVNGNISLRGSSNVRVLINGKPSTLTGSNLTDILQSIPASAIETIEVITNPSSKYDSEGDSGIINIVMKKNAQTGFTASASATAGTQNTVNSTLSLAYQNKKINVYGNYSYRSSDRIGNGFIDKTTNTDAGVIPAISQYTNQISNQTFHNTGSNIRSGIDFFLDSKNTLSFSDNINLRTRNLYQNGLTNITQNGAPYQLQNQDNTTIGTGANLDFSLDFDHKFKKKQEELTASVGYSDDNSDTHAYLNTSTTNFTAANSAPNIYDDYTKGVQHNINLQSDFTLPLTNGRFEAGYRGTLNRSDNNYIADTLNSSLLPPLFQYSPTLSNDFIYRLNVEAIYSNYQHTFGKFSVQGGLRLEDANINTQLNSNNAVTNYTQDYLRLYPTLFLTEKLNDNETIQLSYGRRVTRPTANQLSPFLDVSNKQNYTQGNPELLPQDVHSFELSYINYWSGITLTSSLYYRLTNDNIQQVVTPLTPTDFTTSLSTYENIASATNAGYELIAKISPSNVLDLTANLNVYYAYIDGYAPLSILSSSGYSYNGNLTASVKASKKLAFQLRGDYQGAQPVEQGTNLARYGMDGGIKYDATKALTLSVNSRDIFNTRKYETTYLIDGKGYTENETSQRRFATRTVMFTLAYHIGSNSASKKKDKEKAPTDNPDNPDDPNGGGINPNKNENSQGTLGQPPASTTPPKGRN